MSKKHTNAVKSHYDQLAHSYDQRWNFYNSECYRCGLEQVTFNSGEKVLDIGCGTGLLLEKILSQKKDLDLFGIDLSEQMLEKARQRLKDYSISLHHGDVHQLPFEDNSFDHVLSISSFHYWQNPQQALSEIRRVLRPRGSFALTDWSREALTMKALHYYLKLKKSAYIKTYTPLEIKNMLEESQFTIDTIKENQINWFWRLLSVVAKAPSP